MNYSEDSEFKKEFKRFSRKWRSLPQDLKIAKNVLETLYSTSDEYDATKAHKAFFNGKRATILHTSSTYEIVKMRLDCASLGNKNLLRLIFTFVHTERGITFIELYSKNEKPREDESRIKKYLK